jgi:hypothetical protein
MREIEALAPLSERIILLARFFVFHIKSCVHDPWLDGDVGAERIRQE